MKKCEYCSKQLERKVWYGKRKYTEPTKRFNERKFCDNECRSKQLGIDSLGEKNFFYGKKLKPWNLNPAPEHKIKTGKGYIQVRYFENGVKKVKYEHRLVMERKIGRELMPEEVVHHIDHDITNNDINNLMLFSNDNEHKRFHATETHGVVSVNI